MIGSGIPSSQSSAPRPNPIVPSYKQLRWRFNAQGCGRFQGPSLPENRSDWSALWVGQRAAMPIYRFTTRLRQETKSPDAVIKYPNDDAAITAARAALARAATDAALERFLLDEEIEIFDDEGTLVALIKGDDVRH